MQEKRKTRKEKGSYEGFLTEVDTYEAGPRGRGCVGCVSGVF
jgi:hypothetical protein